ncbi:pyridoxal-phosphate dependent enzyme [Streptosporangium lutulentum]
MPRPPAPYSSARRAGDLLFVSGQLGFHPDGTLPEGLDAQTRQALANLDAVLAEHGLGRDDVVKCQVFLASIADWSALNALYEEYFTRPYPARSAFGVQLHPGALVEIEAIAFYPPSSGASETSDDRRRTGARSALLGRVVRTPVLGSAALDALTGCPTLAKAECLQLTGSFKVRGALYRITTLPPGALSAGLVTVSAGNAALGAAHACRELGVELTVVMPEKAVPEKLAAVAALGATVVKDGVTGSAVAFERAEALRAERGLTFVHPFDDPMVIAGAATATLELLEDHPDLERLLVPCSGGGLLAGAIMAARTAGSSVEVVGVQPSGADGIVRSLAAGRPVAPPVISTIADGLTAPKPGEVNLAVIAEAGCVSSPSARRPSTPRWARWSVR